MSKRVHTPGGATPAVVAMRAAGIAFTEHHYDHDEHAASFGLEAAEALGLSPDEVFKTLLVAVGRAGDLVVAVVPVQGSLDLKAVASATGSGCRPGFRPARNPVTSAVTPGLLSYSAAWGYDDGRGITSRGLVAAEVCL